MPISDDTILRQLKRHAAVLRAKQTIRVAGIDDWAWRKGFSYGTIVVDLEQEAEKRLVVPRRNAA